jgi:hypothetical protein
MKRVWGHVLAGSSVMAGVCAVFAACTHDDSSLFVRGVLAQQLVTSGQQCVYTGDPTQAMVSGGTLDVALRTEYYATILVGNQLVAQANSNQLETETSIVALRGAVIRITDSSGNQLASFTSPTSGTISAATGGTPSYAPVSLTILDQKTALSVASAGGTPVTSYIRFFGQTTGGKSIESGEFGFPITVCSGCLIGASPMSNNPACPFPNCFGTGSSNTQLPTPCTPGQDVAIDCSQCQGVPACRLGVPAGVTLTNCLADAGAG